jgi:16S rRNA (adenine1518-N6/adenine1519-N6)-dimethyltransferase
MNVTEIKQLLASQNIRLTKSLGQNFLHDANQLRRIIAASQICSAQNVLEVGPGLGALTHHLLSAGARVLAIEKDKRLCDLLASRFAGSPNITLMHADALDYLRAQKSDWSDWKLVSNLPYSVGSVIIVELAKSPSPPERMVVTVQLEVARRLAASAGQADYGLLSLLVQARFEPKKWFEIPSPCFFPAPDVGSACVTLLRRPSFPLEHSEYPAFEKIVKLGFSQRRKMMLKLLKQSWPPARLEMAFEQLSISLQARAESVTLEQFVGLTRLLSTT